jgi:hypothetical protein
VTSTHHPMPENTYQKWLRVPGGSHPRAALDHGALHGALHAEQHLPLLRVPALAFEQRGTWQWAWAATVTLQQQDEPVQPTKVIAVSAEFARPAALAGAGVLAAHTPGRCSSSTPRRRHR